MSCTFRCCPGCWCFENASTPTLGLRESLLIWSLNLCHILLLGLLEYQPWWLTITQKVNVAKWYISNSDIFYSNNSNPKSAIVDKFYDSLYYICIVFLWITSWATVSGIWLHCFFKKNQKNQLRIWNKPQNSKKIKKTLNWLLLICFILEFSLYSGKLN